MLPTTCVENIEVPKRDFDGTGMTSTPPVPWTPIPHAALNQRAPGATNPPEEFCTCVSW